MNSKLSAPLPVIPCSGGLPRRTRRRPHQLALALAALMIAVSALTFLAWLAADGVSRQQRSCLMQALDRRAKGASVYRLVGASQDRARVAWQPISRGGLDFPRGPLPGATDYRAAALAGFYLNAPVRVILRTAVDDGLTVRVDGKIAYAAPGRQSLRKAETGLTLGRGLHFMEAEYTQNMGDACWLTVLLDSQGRALDLIPLEAGFDTARWQGLKRRQYLFGQLKLIGLASTAGLFLVLFLAVAIVFASRLERLFSSLKKEAIVFRAGLALGFISQAIYLCFNHDQWAWARLTLVPAGLALFLAILSHAIRSATGWLALLSRAARSVSAWLSARQNWLAPPAAWAGCAAFWGAWVLAHGVSLRELLLTPRWDAVWYRLIMARGYFVVFHDGGEITGNHAWFPLYPWLARATRLLGLDYTAGMLLTGWVAGLAAFFLLHRLARELWGARAALWAVVLLACYPCSFYLFLAFPYGTCLAFSLAFYLALWRHRYGLAALLGFLMSLSYTIGAVGGVAAFALILSRLWRARDKWPELWGLALACSAVLAGVLALCLHHWFYFGDFWLAFSSHADWGRHPAWPWQTIWLGASTLSALDPVMAPILLVIVATAVFAHRFETSLWWLLLATFLLPPTTGFLGSNFRQYLMLWPLFLLVAGSPKPAWCKLLLALAMLWLGVALYLPLLLAGRLA